MKKIQSHGEKAYFGAFEVRDKLKILQKRADKLSDLLRAFCGLYTESVNMDKNELEDRISDLESGKRSMTVSERKTRPCFFCGRPIPRTQVVCMYCGGENPLESLFDAFE